MDSPLNWTAEDLRKLKDQAESIRLEFKRSMLFSEQREQIAKNLSKEVSAFANAEGGTILIGIKERKVGKAKVADGLDEGVDWKEWSPERVQQLIESNVRPFLTGLRVMPVSITPDRCAYVIVVPAGNTAYQASDFVYYGRSEYECKPLPDHEVRLRMYRGQKPNAVVKMIDTTKKLQDFTLEKAQEELPEHVVQRLEVKKVRNDQFVEVLWYGCKLGIENTGETNITEFKALVEYPKNNRFRLRDTSTSFKDGWLNSNGFGPFVSQLTPQPMQINIFPRDTFQFNRIILNFSPKEHIASFELTLKWTLFLKDALPIQGQIDVIESLRELTAV